MRIAFNILAITGSGMFAGAMLVIGVTLGGYWRSLPAADFLDWFSRNSPYIMKAIPLALAPTLIGLAGSLWLGWGDFTTRALWIAATLCIAAVFLLTAVWFGPNNGEFSAKTVPLDQVPARLGAWLMMQNLRIALGVLATVLGGIALARPGV